MIHNKIHPISPGLSPAQYSLTVQNRALKYQSFNVLTSLNKLFSVRAPIDAWSRVQGVIGKPAVLIYWCLAKETRAILIVLVVMIKYTRKSNNRVLNSRKHNTHVLAKYDDHVSLYVCFWILIEMQNTMHAKCALEERIEQRRWAGPIVLTIIKQSQKRLKEGTAVAQF